MQTESSRIPLFQDPLGEVLHQLKLTGMLYCRADLSAPWGVGLPPFDDCLMFHIVTEGHGWLLVEGRAPVLLQTGSLVLLPHGRGHTIASDPEQVGTPLFDIPVDKVSERLEVMRHGGGDGSAAITRATCGVARFDHMVGKELIKYLPEVIHIHTWLAEENNWLRSTLNFIAREAADLKPGSETMIAHLADILIILAIRTWLDKAPVEGRGWIAALHDKPIGRALAIIHRHPEKEWSVAGLAREVGMSRSGFSARFSDLVGESVMRYITRWRMQLARLQLQETPDPLVAVAERLGYQSEAAFCRAFKREFGTSPGACR